MVHVFLVDGSSFVFRAYFQSINQDAKYNYRSDGLPTGAIRLFSTSPAAGSSTWSRPFSEPCAASRRCAC